MNFKEETTMFSFLPLPLKNLQNGYSISRGSKFKVLLKCSWAEIEMPPYLDLLRTCLTMCVPNLVLLDKSAQLAWFFQLCRRTIMTYVSRICPDHTSDGSVLPLVHPGGNRYPRPCGHRSFIWCLGLVLEFSKQRMSNGKPFSIPIQRN